MTDNFFNGCPAKCGPGFREMTNYAPNMVMNEYISFNNGIIRDDDYRLYLQQNGKQLGTNEWQNLRKNNSCFPNECIYNNKRSLVHPNVFNEEMKNYNSTPYGYTAQMFKNKACVDVSDKWNVKPYNENTRKQANAFIYSTPQLTQSRDNIKCANYHDMNLIY